MAAKLDTLVADFEKKSKTIAIKVDLEIERILEEFVSQIAKAGPDIGLRSRVLANVDKVVERYYGKGSVFEKLVGRYLGKAGATGRKRIREDAKRIGYRANLRAASVDAASVVAAATDTYAIAARYLTRAAVDDLRAALVEEMIRGGGEKALRERLISGGFIRDLKVGKRTLRGEARAAVMARTEPHRIANATYNENARSVEPEVEDRLYRWISALGPTVGQDSLRRHGVILSEKEWETTDFGDGMYGLPPIRPNDNCTYVFYPRRALPKDLRRIVDEKPPGEARRTVGSVDGPLWEKLYAEKIRGN